MLCSNAHLMGCVVAGQQHYRRTMRLLYLCMGTAGMFVKGWQPMSWGVVRFIREAVLFTEPLLLQICTKFGVHDCSISSGPPLQAAIFVLYRYMYIFIYMLRMLKVVE